MPIIVDVEGTNKTFEFPDGTPEEVISESIRKQLAQEQGGRNIVDVEGEPTTFEFPGGKTEAEMEDAIRQQQQQPFQQPAPQVQPQQPAQQIPFGAIPRELPPGTPPAGPDLAAGIEPLLTIGSAVAAEPVAGFAGLATLPQGPEQAARAVQQTREQLTFAPRTQGGREALQNIGEGLSGVGETVGAVTRGLGQADLGGGLVEAGAKTVAAGAQVDPGEAGFELGGPVGGAIGETIPTAVLEVAGLGAIRRAARAAKVDPELDPNTAEAIESAKPKSDVDSIKTEVEPESQTFKKIMNDLRNKQAKNAADAVRPDAEVLAAAEDLGVDLNPSHYSTNRAFIDVENALKSRPDSRLSAIEEKAIQDLANRADDLIVTSGGEIDKSLLNANIRDDIHRTIRDLEKESGKLYNKVNNTIPRNTRVAPKASRAYMEKTLDDLGGDERRLTKAEKQLLEITGREGNLTYAALDRLRKDVGDGFRSRTGPFADESSANLKQVYRVLSEDQQGVSDAFGVGADYAAARKLVQTRKGVEDQAIKMFGKDDNGSVVSKITQSATGLSKGDVKKFNELMKSLPKNRRAEVAATLLNDVFTQGARTKGALGQGFVKSFEGLNRNKAAKDILFNELPPESRARFDKIGKVATGIFKSKALENTSKTARDVVTAMNEGGLFVKVLNAGARGARKVPGAGQTLSGLVLSIADKGTKSSGIAENFITSKAFRDAIETAARGNPAQAEKILQASPAFKRWLTTATPENAAQITAAGFIPWVTDQINEEEE